MLGGISAAGFVYYGLPRSGGFGPMLRRLRADHNVRSLLCEGGPTVFGAMLHEGLVDELFLTISPCLAGGGMDPTITRGPELPELTALEPRWILEHEGALFLRYARRETGGS